MPGARISLGLLKRAERGWSGVERGHGSSEEAGRYLFYQFGNIVSNGGCRSQRKKNRIKGGGNQIIQDRKRGNESGHYLTACLSLGLLIEKKEGQAITQKKKRTVASLNRETKKDC